MDMKMIYGYGFNMSGEERGERWNEASLIRR